MTERAQSQRNVRKISELHADWTAAGSGQEGQVAFHMILNDGAEEAVVQPTVIEGVLLTLLYDAGKTSYFDTERQMLLVNDIEKEKKEKKKKKKEK